MKSFLKVIAAADGVKACYQLLGQAYQLPDVCMFQSFGKTEVCNGLHAWPIDVQQIPGNNKMRLISH